MKEKSPNRKSIFTPEQEKKIVTVFEFAIFMSPSEKEKNGFINMHNKMLEDKMTAEYVIKQFIGAIYDGLNYGNWPK